MPQIEMCLLQKLPDAIRHKGRTIGRIGSDRSDQEAVSHSLGWQITMRLPLFVLQKRVDAHARSHERGGWLSDTLATANDVFNVMTQPRATYERNAADRNVPASKASGCHK
jgi:hypothetical protein